jgi:uncharacterized lipoprotein YddW (UPF0748 family)
VALSLLLISGIASAKPEYRALWVDTWNPGILDAEQAKLTVSRAQNHNFNTLFVEVSKTMDAYYNSEMLPRATNIQNGYDPLATVLHYAKAPSGRTRPLEVHAWIVALRAWKDKPLPSTSLNPPHVMRKHPDWVSKNYRGARFDDDNYFLDPGHPEVQDFICAIAREIVSKYPVDGLHLDYIRYPGNQWGYNEVALKRFQQELGRKDIPKPEDAEWSAWRRQQVNNLVRRISSEIHEIRPQVELSAAAITWGDVPGGDFTKTRAYNDALQNWVGWMEAGYLDIAAPMVYKRSRDSLQARDFVDWVKLGNQTKSNRHFIAGLGAWFNPLSDTGRQVDVALKHGSEGVCFFSYNQLENTDRTSPYVLRDISGSIFKAPAPIPRADWLERPTTGTLAGADPKRRGGYPVLLLDERGQKRAEIRTDANGHFAFFGLPPGTWRAQVGRASILSEPVRIQRGKVSRALFR